MEQTTCTASTSGNRFNIAFDPRTTGPRPQADDIQFIQSIQMTADGAPIKPGAYYSGFAYRDRTAVSDATYVDHLASFRTPYLAENGHGTAGFCNSSGAANATFADGPNTGGGDKGFKSAANPTGWTTVIYNFQTLTGGFSLSITAVIDSPEGIKGSQVLLSQGRGAALHQALETTLDASNGVGAAVLEMQRVAGYAEI
jgi:hypothetical protein